MRLGKAAGAHRHADGLVRVQGLDELSADLRIVLVDDGDRQVPQQLAQIGLRIQRPVKQGGQHDQAKCTLVMQHAADLGKHRSADPSRGRGLRNRFRTWRAPRRGVCYRAQAPPTQRKQHGGEDGEHHQRLDRHDRWKPSHRLIEQYLNVPTQRQQRAPEMGKPVHRQQREADAGEAKSRRTEDRGYAETHCQLAYQKLEQRSHRQIADHQQTSAGAGDHRVASEGHVEHAVDDPGFHHQHHDEHGKQRCQLADQRGEGAATGGAQPRR